MTELTDEEKKMLMDAIGVPLGEAMKNEMPNIIKRGEENKKEYIERLTRIETKLDVLLSGMGRAIPR